MASILAPTETALAPHSERPIHFKFRDYEISGILHTPANLPASGVRTGILFLNSGLRYRIGPYRQYVRFARKFCAAGYYVMRFDFPGAGESSGEIRDYSVYREMFLNNKDFTRTALDKLIAETGVADVHSFGMCSGAYNSLLSGGADPRIKKLILLSLPSVQLGELTQQSVSDLRVYWYWRKLFQWRSWVNLLMFRSKFRSLGRAILAFFQRGRKGLQVDPDVWNGVRRFTQSGDILLAYGGQDPFYQFYLETLAKRLPELGRQAQARITTQVVEPAGHTFSQIRFQDDVFERALAWLDPASRPQE
jgi:pimeloyl-ACP methyl ester carboxylesterase